ncbi:MAG: branched-chain amino acid ABC transporter permease [Rhodocyclaceae bacterium]
MDLQIALLLGQDGIVTGAIYALLALALVLVFAVTRVIFIPQGEFVAYGALTLAGIQSGQTPGTIWLLLALGVAVTAIDAPASLRAGRGRLLRLVASQLVYPFVIIVLLLGGSPRDWPQLLQVLLALAIVVPLGPQLYRLVYQPIAEATVLVLLIASVALHLTLVGLGLLFFGAEGSRTQAFSEATFDLGALTVSGQSLWVISTSLLLIVALYVFFENSLYGKALRATAVNRVGARLMGISTTLAGRMTFLLAAAIGALSGILIAPITTVYYDTGFLIGLKGFVGAIIGGLASYPVAAAGAVLVGLLESFSSFWASAFKEVIVFTLIIPVLLWRSLTTRHIEEEE